MTLFLDFRTAEVGGAVWGPQLLEGDGAAQPLALRVVPDTAARRLLAGRSLVFATHGFNVRRSQGARALGALDQFLQLPPPYLMIGMLWPGDSWLPVVDYPFEGEVAMDCGARLARYCGDLAAGAESFSFVSHSLGARLVLEAVARLGRKARSVCLTAAAINRDCLTAEYTRAARNAERIAVLASHEDWVLKVAFTVGDPLAWLLRSDHELFRLALGYDGPPPNNPAPVARPWQISDAENYGHGSYLPPSSGVAFPPASGAQWPEAARFMRRALLGEVQTWPII